MIISLIMIINGNDLDYRDYDDNDDDHDEYDDEDDLFKTASQIHEAPQIVAHC